MGQALKSETPGSLATKFLHPKMTKELATIKNLVPKKQWEEFRNGFITELMDAPTAQQGLNRLRRFQSQPDTLKVLMDGVEEKQLEKFLLRKIGFDGSTARKVMEKQLTDGEKFIALAKDSTAGEIKHTVELAGGVDSLYAKSARAGVYRDILRKSMTRNVKGEEIMDVNIFTSEIKKWRQTEKLDFLFRPKDWRAIELYEKYTYPLTATADIGGGMVGGGFRQKLIESGTDTLYGDIKKVGTKVVKPYLNNFMMAWLLTQPASVTRIHAVRRVGIPLTNLAIAIALAERQYERANIDNIYEKEDRSSSALDSFVETLPFFHKGGLITKDAGLKQLAEKYDAIPDLQRDKQLRQLHHYNNNTFNQLLDYLENR